MDRLVDRDDYISTLWSEIRFSEGLIFSMLAQWLVRPMAKLAKSRTHLLSSKSSRYLGRVICAPTTSVCH